MNDRKERKKFTIYTDNWQEFLARSFIERRRKIIYQYKLPFCDDVEDVWEFDPSNRKVKRTLVITLENRYILPVESKAKKIFKEYYVKLKKEEFDEGIYFVYIIIDGKKNGKKIIKIPPNQDELNRLMSITPKFLKEIEKYIKPYEQENNS